MKYAEIKRAWATVFEANTILPKNFEEVLDHYGIIPEGNNKAASIRIEGLSDCRLQFFGIDSIGNDTVTRIRCEVGTYENAEEERKRVSFFSETREYLPEIPWRKVFDFLAIWLKICGTEREYMKVEKEWAKVNQAIRE